MAKLDQKQKTQKKIRSRSWTICYRNSQTQACLESWKAAKEKLCRTIAVKARHSDRQ